ncbi:MAG: hypothetical protein LUH02_12160, partial [Erysipelotrichaceae bacterium]|nr:hypothetical protein [Erysipelotrichaceae bacterium]
MNHFVIDFGSYNMIAKVSDGQLEQKKYNSIIDYEHETFKFKSKIKITDKDTNIGDKAKQSHNAIFINNLCQEFKNPRSTYSLSNKKYTINQIVEKYFIVIKNELNNHSENEPIDALTLVIPYEYTKTNKENLKKILNNIKLKCNHMIEEPIANYFGYLNTNHLDVPHKDSFMMLNID